MQLYIHAHKRHNKSQDNGPQGLQINKQGLNICVTYILLCIDGCRKDIAKISVILGMKVSFDSSFKKPMKSTNIDYPLKGASYLG